MTDEQAKRILARDGPNALTPPPRTPEWVKFCKNLFGGFALLLWIGAFLCFFAYTVDWITVEDPLKDNVKLQEIYSKMCLNACFDFYHVSVVFGYRISGCGYRYWLLPILSRSQKFKDYGFIFQVDPYSKLEELEVRNLLNSTLV